MNERRQLPRWEIRKVAKLSMPPTQGFQRCIIEDMHLKGMRIFSDRELFQGQTVNFSLTIEDTFDLKIGAQIAWVRQDMWRYFYGLSFTKIDDKDKERLYQYLNTKCLDQFKNKWWASDTGHEPL